MEAKTGDRASRGLVLSSGTWITSEVSLESLPEKSEVITIYAGSILRNDRLVVNE